MRGELKWPATPQANLPPLPLQFRLSPTFHYFWAKMKFQWTIQNKKGGNKICSKKRRLQSLYLMALCKTCRLYEKKVLSFFFDCFSPFFGVWMLLLWTQCLNHDNVSVQVIVLNRSLGGWAKDRQQQDVIRGADVLRFITLAHIRCCFPLTELAQKRGFSVMWSMSCRGSNNIIIISGENIKTTNYSNICLSTVVSPRHTLSTLRAQSAKLFDISCLFSRLKTDYQLIMCM